MTGELSKRYPTPRLEEVPDAELWEVGRDVFVQRGQLARVSEHEGHECGEHLGDGAYSEASVGRWRTSVRVYVCK